MVEKALEHQKAKVHKIQNPAKHITEYRFEHGWQDIAESSKNLSPGARVQIDNREAEVLGV